MTRILLAVLLLGMITGARAGDYTDIWYNPQQQGYGYNAVQSDDGVVGVDGKVRPFLFVTFFIFASNGEPTWYTAELRWNGTDAFMGPVYKSRGTFFGNPWNPADNTAINVGTATFKPNATNDYQATFIYVVNGVGSATHPLERQTLTGNYVGGNFVGFELGQYVGGGCNLATNPYLYTDRYALAVTDNSGSGGNVNFQFIYASGLTCIISGRLVQHGLTMLVRNAAYVCSDGTNTQAQVFGLRRTALGLEGSYSAAFNASCTVSGNFSGPLDQ